MLLALLATLTCGQLLEPADPDGDIITNPAVMNRLAFFDAFPSSDAGTTTACSTTAPTGARGEVLTFTRTGNATCSKQGPATTGILDGDLVVLGSNIARVSSVGGLLMFLRESARTNSAARSEAFDNAYWSKVASGTGVAPTVTANAGIAPDNTLTAERIQFSACPTAPSSSEVQVNTGVGSATSSLFVKGYNNTSGTIRLCQFNTGNCVTINYVGDSWTRLSTSGGAGGTYMVFGCLNNSIYSGFSNTGAADVLVWGAQHEAGAWMTGYIPTVAAAASRQAESALSATLTTGIGPNFSIGVTTAYASASVTTATALQLGSGAPNLASVGRSTNTAAAFTINATSTTPAVSAMGTSVLRGSLNDSSGTRTAWWNGGSVSAPVASMTGSATALSFGALDAYTGRACADPAPARCDL